MRWVIGIAALLLFGLLTGASMLVYSAYVLIGIHFLTLRLSRRWANSVRAERGPMKNEIEIDESVTVTLKVENRDRWSIVWMLLEDALPRSAMFGPPPAMMIQGSNLKLVSLVSRQPKLLTYKLTARRRGLYQIGPLVAETGDLFGLHRRFRSITRSDMLLVLPRIVPLDGYSVQSQRPIGEIRVTYRLLEDPTLISGIRQYQHGDPMRSIHWRATARTGTLQTKQYQPTCVAGAQLILDMHKRSNPDRHEPIRTDLAVTAAASIAHTLMQMQQPFGLLSNGRDAADRLADDTKRDFESRGSARKESAMLADSQRLRPVILGQGRGADHFMTMHRTLARLERTDGLELPELLVESQGRLVRDATILIILQELDENAAIALGMLKRQGFTVSAIVNNYENEAYQIATERLVAARIAVYHLLDEDSIAHICTQIAAPTS